MKNFSTVSPRFFLAIHFLLFLLFATAGTTGKISGKVTDARTGEPMIGANVVIRGTTMGTITDQNGAYFIIIVGAHGEGSAGNASGNFLDAARGGVEPRRDANLHSRQLECRSGLPAG